MYHLDVLGRYCITVGSAIIPLQTDASAAATTAAAVVTAAAAASTTAAHCNSKPQHFNSYGNTASHVE